MEVGAGKLSLVRNFTKIICSPAVSRSIFSSEEAGRPSRMISQRPKKSAAN
jgi:hypothetical protein